MAYADFNLAPNWNQSLVDWYAGNFANLPKNIRRETKSGARHGRSFSYVETGIINGTFLSSIRANFELGVKGYSRPPYTSEKKVVELAADGKTEFVRVWGAGGFSEGASIMKRVDIEGFTTQQIADKFVLPDISTHFRSLFALKGTVLRVGQVNPNCDRPGGAQQFELMEVLPNGWMDDAAPLS